MAGVEPDVRGVVPGPGTWLVVGHRIGRRRWRRGVGDERAGVVVSAQDTCSLATDSSVVSWANGCRTSPSSCNAFTARLAVGRATSYRYELASWTDHLR